MSDFWHLAYAARGELAYAERAQRAEYKDLERAVTIEIRKSMKGHHRRLRGQVTRALSKQAGNAIRFDNWPARGFSANYAARVRSNLLVESHGRHYDLVSLFAEGAQVRPVRGRFIAIPLPAAGTKRAKNNQRVRKTPRDFPAGTFVALPVRGRADRKRLVFKKRPDVTAFILVSSVKLKKKRLSPEKSYAKAHTGIGARIVKNWEARSEKRNRGNRRVVRPKSGLKAA